MSEDSDRAKTKPPSVDRLSQLWRRINDYKIAQWSVAYVALAYGIQHGIILTSESFEWPNAVARISMLLLALGLPLVMAFAWYHGERASRHFSKAEVTIISILLVIGSMFFYVFVQPSEQIAAGLNPAVQQAGVAAARNASLNPGAISIAVLPFANLSGDSGQEFFSDGMTEEIMTALAKVSALRVVGRESAFQFKERKTDMKAVGQALGASYLVEGSVRKAGDQVRITAQLVQADSGVSVWTDSYDRELKNIFATQSDIAQAIAGALRVPLGMEQGARLVSNRTADLASYQQYLRGRALVRARSLADAISILEPAVVRDPKYAPTWAMLAQAYDLTPNQYAVQFNDSGEGLSRIVNASLPKAEMAARRAIELDANLADGYVALARVQDRRGKALLAEELYSKALALDPNNPEALHAYGMELAALGHIKEAVAMRQRLRELEPFVPVFNFNTASVLWLDGRNDDATAMANALQSPLRQVVLSTIYAGEGRYSEAADMILEGAPGNNTSAATVDAVRLMRTAPAIAASPQTLPRLGLLDFVYLYIGAPDRALEYREGQLEAGYLVSISNAVLWHPTYAAVRKTERFKAFVRKAGMVEYWRVKGWPEFCHSTTGDDFVCV